MKELLSKLNAYFDWFYIPQITVADIVEIIILSYLVYNVILWFKKTRAWTLVKGFVVLILIMALATIFGLNCGFLRMPLM